MKKDSNKKAKNMTIEDLAAMTAKGFSSIEQKMLTKNEFNSFKEESIQNFKRVDESLIKVRRDILELGDRFVSKSEFDTFMIRFNALEAKVKGKK